MKKVLFIISLLALAACDFPHSTGKGPPRPDRADDGSLPQQQSTPAPPAAQ